MKWYEVRANEDNTKVWLNEPDYVWQREGDNIIYDGDFDFTTVLKQVDYNMFVPEFRGMCDSITIDKLKAMNFDLEEASKYKNFTWVFENSDHRKDLRIVDERYYQALKDGKTDKQIVTQCDHLFTNYPYSFERKKILTTKAIHKLGEFNFDEPEIAFVSQADDENYYGMMVNVPNFVDVKFPKEFCEIIEDEKNIEGNENV